MSDDCKKEKADNRPRGCLGSAYGVDFWIIWGNTALQLNKYTVSSERLPRAFDGCKIAHISDLHNTEIGKTMKLFLIC